MSRSKNPQARARARLYRATKQRQQLDPDPQRSIRHMRRLENELKSVISMKTDRDNESSIRDCNLQQQSPLFRCGFVVISKIFEYALSQSEDKKESYPKNTSYYRPDHHAPHGIHTSLLLTCRRAWLEFNHLPMSSATHFFWFFNGPPGTLTSARQFSQYFQKMTPRNLETLRHVQLFTFSHWIDGIGHSGTFNTLFGYKAFAPKTLTITMRHVDWEDYNSHAPLTFKTDWAKQFLYSRHMTRVEHFKLDLETVLHKEDQLDELVQTLKDMFDLRNIHDAKDNDPQTGRPLGWQFKLSETLQKSNWDNPAAPGGLESNRYVVVKMIWNRISVPFEVEPPSVPASTNKQINARKRREAFEAAGRLRQEEVWQQQEQPKLGPPDLREEEKTAQAGETVPHKRRHAPRGGRRSHGVGVQISKTEWISNLDHARMKTSDKWAKELSLLQLTPLPPKSE